MVITLISFSRRRRAKRDTKKEKGKRETIHHQIQKHYRRCTDVKAVKPHGDNVDNDVDNDIVAQIKCISSKKKKKTFQRKDSR